VYTPPAPAPVEPPPLEMDFSMPPVAEPEPVRLETPSLNVDEHSLNFEPVAPAPAPVAAAPVAAPPKGDMLEFDLGGLSLDLPGSNAPAPAPAIPSSNDMSLDLPPVTAGGDVGGEDSPLATKLALAEEFNAIGDADGARSLAEEVLAEASGDLKSRAQRLLAEIG
jgi:pilus assembly protein FimV